MDLFEFAAQQQPDARSRYDELCRIIQHNNELYYAQAQPEITDAEYDALYRELEAIEAEHPEYVTPDSPTQRVGNDLSEGFRKVRHPRPMQSIDDIFEHKPGDGDTDAELVEFYTRLSRSLGQDSPQVVIEPKIDGCAVTLMYRDGKLEYAATRGDGQTGDDITANILTIKSIPRRLPEDAPSLLEVRGEVYMPFADFNRLNEQRDAEGLPTLANPRNATAGTIKLLDVNEVAARPLAFLAHGLGEYEGAPLHSAADFVALLQRMGIPCNAPIITADGVEAVRQAVKDIDALRRNLGYGTDGAVIKLADIALREQLGSTARAPRWAAAFKYLPEQKETVLRAITIQVGRTGVLTPVAELEPVHLSGTTVSRATLHNQDEISRKDIRIGDTVLVEKSGEIIPAIVHVNKDKRPQDAVPYSLFDAVNGVCPCCGEPISQEEGQVAWRCTNFTCAAQAAMRTTYFCKREALDVESLGGTVAEALVRTGMISSPLDLFDLTVEQLGSLNLGTDDEPRRFGEKNAAKALETLNNARNLPLERWLTAFGIPGIGRTTSVEIAKRFSNIQEVAHSDFLISLRNITYEIRKYEYLSPSATRPVPYLPLEESLNLQQRAAISKKWNWRQTALSLYSKHDTVAHDNIIHYINNLNLNVAQFSMEQLRYVEPFFKRAFEIARCDASIKNEEIQFKQLLAKQQDIVCKSIIEQVSSIQLPIVLICEYRYKFKNPDSSDISYQEYQKEKDRASIVISKPDYYLKVFIWKDINVSNDVLSSKKGKRKLSEYRVENEVHDWASFNAALINNSFSNVALNVAKLEIISPLGPVAIDTLISYFLSSSGKHVLDTLSELGITADSNYAANPVETNSMISGKTFVLTGSLSEPRPIVAKQIEAIGGKVAGSITKNTDYLVAGEGGGSKRSKAEKLNIPIINEETLRKMMASSQEAEVKSTDEAAVQVSQDAQDFTLTLDDKSEVVDSSEPEVEEPAVDKPKLKIINSECKNCGYQYGVPSDTFGLARMTCPNCRSRIYARTGTVVKHIAEFHEEFSSSNDPKDWRLGDFAQVLMAAGRGYLFDLVDFMTALTKLPEWDDLEFASLQYPRKFDYSISECFQNDSKSDLIYHLGVIFNHLSGVLKRVDHLGFGHWQSYINRIRGIKSEPSTKRKPSIKDEDFVYEGMLNENGEAVGMDIPMSIRGKRIIITGKLDQPRNYYSNKIEELGGIFASTVSQSDYLVIGENHVQKISKKAKEAQRYGVPVVTLNSLKRALEEAEQSMRLL